MRRFLAIARTAAIETMSQPLSAIIFPVSVLAQMRSERGKERLLLLLRDQIFQLRPCKNGSYRHGVTSLFDYLTVFSLKIAKETKKKG